MGDMHQPTYSHQDHDEALDDIAIVGAACRLPGEASSLRGLWNMMLNARSAHAKVPAQRWDADAWYHPDSDRKGALNTTHGFFLGQDVDTFDAPFFSVTAKEAAGMDPAKRLLLEVSYEAFENAGIPMETVVGTRTGVYVGSMTSDYEALSTRDIYDMPHMAAAGSSEAMTANRVSWFFDLRGPSLTLDTACSSSLYALHLACQSLRLRETNMSLVAGVNVILHPNFMQQLVAMHMLSPDGISHAFDDRANGYGRGEGIGALVVKRLSDAIRDGDTIRAVIRGSGVNVDGKTPSVTMPSSEAQAELIRNTYEEADLSIEDTGYVELHGTGTPIGDPIELTAIAATFGAAASPERPVHIGSIKPNVGHTEGCAGLAGVFKAILCLENGVIVPTAKIENINPKLKIADWNLSLPQTALAWPNDGLRRISINSFGFGGANAHVILDDAYNYMRARGMSGNHNTTIAPPSDLSSVFGLVANGHADANLPKKLFVLSSPEKSGIKRLSESLQAYWSSESKFNHEMGTGKYAADVAYTLSTRRSLFDHRSFAVADSAIELASELAKGLLRFKVTSKQNGLAFVFTGQGAQWAGMGRQLIADPVFAASIARSKQCLESVGCPFDLEVELQKTKDSKIDTSEYSQPICTAVQVALVDLLRDWSIVPRAVVGHSSGEIAAAFTAGIITHEDAIKVAYYRGIYSQKVTNGPKRGGMMAVGISESEAQEFLNDVPAESVVAACINSPKSVTLSGDSEFVDELEKKISAAGKFARKLRIATAYHSPHMRMVAEDCLEAMKRAGMGTPQTTSTLMFSSVTGALIDHQEVTPSYWIRNMCNPVRFSQAVQQLLTYSPSKRASRKTALKWDSLVEIGPHSALKAPLTQIMESVDKKMPSELPYSSALVRGEDAVASALKCAGQLWAIGCPVALDRVNRDSSAGRKPRVVVDLPAYAWNHDKHYWHETYGAREERLQSKARTDLLGVAVTGQNPSEPQWKNHIRVRENPWVEDHRITGTTLYPGAGMLIMVIEATREMTPKDVPIKGIEFRDVHFERGLVIPSEGVTDTLLRIQKPSSDNSLHSFLVSSKTPGNPYTQNCHGSFSILYGESSVHGNEDIAASVDWQTKTTTYEKIKQMTTDNIDVKKLYKSLHSVGMEYGPTFQNLTSLSASPEHGCCYGTVAIPDTKSVMPHEFEFPHIIHPATLDAIFHLIVVAVADGIAMREAAVPFMLERLFISFDLPKGAGSVFSGYSQRVTRRDQQIAADLVVSDEAWSGPKVIVNGLIMRRVSAGANADTQKYSTHKVIDKKVTKLEWKLDIDSTLAECPDTNELASLGKITRLRDWLELECHKTPNLRVLLFGNTIDRDITEEIGPFINNQSSYRGIARLTIVDVSEEALEHWRESTAKATASMDFGVLEYDSEGIPSIDTTPFDIVIAGDLGALRSAPRPVDFPLESMLHPDCRMLIIRNRESVGNPLDDLSSKTNLQLSRLLFEKQELTIASLPKTSKEKPTETYLLARRGPDYDDKLSRIEAAIQEALEKTDVSVCRVTLDNVSSLAGKHIISLLDLESAFILRWSPDEFAQFKQLISSAEHVFWVTRGAYMLEPSEAGLGAAAVPGLFRVLRNEFPQVTLAHLDLSPEFDASGIKGREIIANAWSRSVTMDSDQGTKELELAELGGLMYIPRALPESSLDSEIALTVGAAPTVPQVLSSTGPLRLLTGEGSVDDNAWQKDEEGLTPLDPDQVEIRVVSVSVDLSSLTVESYPEILGSQVAGVVTRCGANVTEFIMGDRVVAFGKPIRKTHIRRHRSTVLRIPDSVPIEASGSVIWLHMLASYILHHVCHVASGQKVLVQDGASGLGQTLLHIAQHSGAWVLTTVKNRQEKEDLISRLGVAADSVIVSDGSSIGSYLLHKTAGTGLDIVIGWGSVLEVIDWPVSCLSEFARIVVVGGDGISSQILPSAMKGNISLSTVDAFRLLSENPSWISRLFPYVFMLMQESGLADVRPISTFDVADLTQALIWSQKPEHRGIMAVEFSSNASVPVLPPPPPQLQLDPNATYVLAGGLGSLGMRIANLMARGGAKHLIFVSRSGGAKYADRLEELHRQGCATTVLKCDVNSVADCQNIVTEAAALARSIKGLVQCAMVLQDSLFDKMTYQQWDTAFRAKVTGTWNLHSALPDDMDFFIMLSSVVSVIGNVSQANYAAGNAYMDAFAHYRRSLGRAAVSINAGLVADSDHTIDGTAMEDYLDRFKHMASVSTTLEELDIAITASLRGTTADGRSIETQFVFCMTDSLQPDSVDSWARDAKFGHRRAVVADNGLAAGDDSSGPNIADALRGSASLQDASHVIRDALKMFLAPGLGVQPSDISDGRPLYEVGVDSFKAVEIRNLVFREFKSDISAFEILSPSPLAQIAGLIASRSQLIAATVREGAVDNE